MKTLRLIGVALMALCLCAGITACSDDDDDTKGKTTGKINGHEYVDLGLTVKWATCNVGASSPSDYGDYLAWGETNPKSNYIERTSTTYGYDISSIEGNPIYDAARANWGGTWRLPTANEIDELINRCTFTKATQDGHKGYLVTGPNGNSIFLPYAGFKGGTNNASMVDSEGLYWSGTSYTDTHQAYILYIDNSNIWRDRDNRAGGDSVRPVSE